MSREKKKKEWEKNEEMEKIMKDWMKWVQDKTNRNWMAFTWLIQEIEEVFKWMLHKSSQWEFI